MNKKECYQKGYNTGYDIAESNRTDYSLADENEREHFASEMMETECESYRQYSPFEFFAHDVNACKNSDGLWEAYDEGVYKGIQKLIKEEVNLLKNNHE